MKVLIFISAFILIILNIEAQTGFYLGVQGSVNNSWILNQNNYETLEDCPSIADSELAYELKPGYMFGGSFGFGFKNNYAIQIDLLFSKAGQKYEDTFSPGPDCPGPYHVKRAVDLNYLQIPVLFKYHSNMSKRTQFSILIGPQFGILTEATETVEINEELKFDLDAVDEKFRKFDVGIAFGIGTDILLIPNQLYLHLGFNTYIGLSDINGKQIQDIEWFSKNDVEYQKSRNFRAGLSLGMFYCFNKESSPFEKND